MSAVCAVSVCTRVGSYSPEFKGQLCVHSANNTCLDEEPPPPSRPALVFRAHRSRQIPIHSLSVSPERERERGESVSHLPGTHSFHLFI